MNLALKMKMFRLPLILIAAGMVAAIPAGRASTVWTGPLTNFNHTVGGLADQITPGVKITRGNAGGLYNSVTESGATGGISPKDTQWALGSIANFATLKYGPCPLEQGNRPPNDVNKTYVVHLVTEDIYFSLTLTGWGGAGGNGQTSFSYARTTPAAVAPPTPTVSITSPAEGASFVAPASVEIDATASVSSGTVTNVQFFTNGVSAGSTPAAPFTLTESDLVAGTYALTAVATSAGVSATSAVVSITVTNAVVPPTITVAITNPPDGAAFTAPASVEIDADASVSSGTVTNVEFFTNGVSLGSVQNSPYDLMVSNFLAGSYALTAVASAGGITATSLVVTISVTNAVSGQPPANITAPGVSAGQFTFSYSTQTGASYVIESSSNLMVWLPLATNVATGDSAKFSDTFSETGDVYYRVSQSPTP